MSSDNPKCRGCGGDLVETQERVVKVSVGKFANSKKPTWKSPKREEVWGHMHERCFLIAIGDPEGVERIATAY
jgi:hypothetical protein